MPDGTQLGVNQNIAAPPEHFSKSRVTVPRRSARRVPAALWRLVSAAMTSSVGDGLVLVALPLFAVTLTTDPVAVAGLAVASGLPWLFVALPAGALVDRVDKRRLVLGIELGRAALLGLLAAAIATGRADMAVLYVAAFLVAVGETFVAAVTRSVVPMIVEDRAIPSANGYVFGAETAGERFAGPALGGVLFAAAASLPFIGDAVSFVASGVLLRSAVPAATAPRPTTRSLDVLRDVRDGVRWFVRHHQLRLLAVVITTFAFCQAMAFAVLVLFATHTLHLHSAAYGLILAVAAIGNVAASMVAGTVHRFLGPFWTVAIAGLCAAGAYMAIGATRSPVVTTLALMLEAAAVTLGNVATLSARHRMIPAQRFGLINNAFRTCVMGVVPVGALVGGALAQAFGVPATFLVAGAVQLGVLLVVSVPLRSIPLDEPVKDDGGTPSFAAPNRPFDASASLDSVADG
jgi:predicted MFS family arabinose efflux permease